MKDLLLRWDLWIIVLYMVGMLVIAWRVSKTSRDVEGYTVGNRRMAGWAIGLSVLGTFTSSISFLGIPSKAFDTNWNVFVFSLSLPIAALVAVRYFVLDEETMKIHEFHFLGIVFAVLVALMLAIGRLSPRSEPYEQQYSGDVDMTPWPWAKLAGAAIVLVVLGIYVYFADLSVLGG